MVAGITLAGALYFAHIMEGSPKQHLYHAVPDSMRSNEEGRKILYPLNILREKFPDLHEMEIGKYSNSEYRKNLPKTIIPTLERATWGDVLHLQAIHPEEIKKALTDAGFHPRELKFYQVDPALLDPEKTTIFLYREGVGDDSIENYSEYNPKKLTEHSKIPEKTRESYRQDFVKKERPVLFVGVPHIFHKGPIDVSDFPVITV